MHFFGRIFKLFILSSVQEIQYMRHLTKKQRYTISVLKKKDYKNKEIASIVGGVSSSTISRKLRINALKCVGYNPQKAQEFYKIRKERFTKNRKFIPEVEKVVRHYFGSDKF